MTHPAERSKIPGHRQYEIDMKGNVYRVEGRNKWKDPLKSIEQSLQRISGRESGYFYVTLVTKDDLDNAGNVIDMIHFRRIGVHRLMCEAFHGPAPAGKPFVRHKNGIRSDNRPDNVEWSATRSKDRQITINSTMSNGEAKIFSDEATEAMRTKFIQEYPLTMEEVTINGDPAVATTHTFVIST